MSKTKKLGFPLERTLVVDDSPEKLQRYYGTLIRVSSWHGESDDTQLRDLIPFLDWIHAMENYRSIEKRDWRRQATRLLAAASEQTSM